MSGGYPPVSELVPHGPRILALERLVDWSPGRARCAMRVDDSSPLVDEGQLASVLLLEPMAQAVAACLGYEAYRRGEGARVGMIVACRGLETRRTVVPVGTRLEIEVERARGNEATSQFDCRVFDADEVVATAVLTLVHARPAGAGG